MSSRELRALIADKPKQTSVGGRTRSSSRRTVECGLEPVMTETESRIAQLESALEEAQRKLSEQREEFERAKGEADQRLEDEIEKAKENENQLTLRLKEVQMELDNSHLRAEVERLRAVERAREEERDHLQRWAEDLRERFHVEKKSFEEKIARLEAETASRASGAPTGGPKDSTSPVSVSDGTSPDTTASSSSTPSTGTTSTSTSASTSVVPSVTSPIVSPTVDRSTSSATGTDIIVKLFESQSQLIAAQVQAATLPPLASFDGQSGDDDTEFERWLEKFEERAKLAKWTPETKLCQLRLHLSKLAEQAYLMLSKDVRSNYDQVIVALKKRFRSVEIAELKGMEFHRRVQGDETIEKLGMDLQKLGQKAFPSMEGKELDRMLKGRFYQALHPRWQRKLNAPKHDETFAQLFERARMLEQHEKQFTASATSRGETKKPKSAGATQPPSSFRSSIVPEKSRPASTTNFVRLCHFCRQPGHLARSCPERLKGMKSEAPGHSSNAAARTSCVEVKETRTQDELTEEELELLLARCRLRKEKEMLPEVSGTDGAVGCITAFQKKQPEPAIGPLFYCDIEVEGVPVTSMVDCGSQTTIISRSLLHRVARQRQKDGRSPPELKVPTVRLYGKDGPSGANQLRITAQVDLRLQVNGETIVVPVFVQPDSTQECLLGTNASIPLGFQFTDGKGKPLRIEPNAHSCSGVARVSLIKTTKIPSRKGQLLKAKVTGDYSPGQQFVFEPEGAQLKQLGIDSSDSLVTVSEEGTIVVPAYNFSDHSVRVPIDSKVGVLEPFDDSSCLKSIQSATCAKVLVDGPGYHTKVDDNRATKLLSMLDLSECDCDESQLGELQALLSKASDVFELDRSELGHSALVQHVIDTGDNSPVKQQPYRTPIVQRERIAQLIREMQQQGIVKPSCSPWASPVVLVPKKDGSTRFCVDFRRLNRVTKKDVYPLPRIDDILDTLAQAKYFSTLDLSAGYWQVELDPVSQSKTAFTTHCGLYEFTRMPFGLCNAPATFQRLMQVVLSGLEWDCCFVYIDDILIASKTFEDHLNHLSLVFERLRKAGLRLKPTKCHFLRDQVPYLGYVISKEGISPDPSKTEKVKSFPRPKDATSVRSFVGLASYYRRFVPNFATVAAPLHRLTKKNVPFEWSRECEDSFCMLKSLLTEAPVLVYPQFGPERSFLLETDASGVGLGAVLSQKQDDNTYHPIAYASKSLQVHEKNYAISELETLAIVWAVKKFRAYLLGHPCTVLTDHAACLSLLNTPRPSAKLARWAMAIQELNLEIKHRSGRANANADALSRHPVDDALTCSVIGKVDDAEEDTSQPVNVDQLQKELQEIATRQQTCPDLSDMFAYLSKKELPEDDKLAKRIVYESRHFDLLDGVLHHESPHFPGRWCVAVPSDLRSRLLDDAHSGLLAGHLAEKRVYDRLRRTYWWSGMRGDVRKHCRSCLACATRKGTGRATRPPLQPIPVGGPFHTIGVDILKLPQTFDGNQYVVVFLDYLTKWVEAFPVADQRAETVARLLVEEVICRHGAPERLLSDRGANFLSGLIAEVCRLLTL